MMAEGTVKAPDTGRMIDPEEFAEIVAYSGLSLRLWRLYAYAWLVCLLFPIMFLAQSHRPPLLLLAATVGLVIFVGVYAVVMWPHPLSGVGRLHTSNRPAFALLTFLTALTLILAFGYGTSAFLWLLLGTSVIAGVLLTARAAFVAVMVLTLLALGAGVMVSESIGQVDWLHLIPLVLLVRGLGLDMVGVSRLSDALRELHSVRKELAQRAVVEERLRLARDLHDLLGHTLSLIILKSELARRLIAKEPARAATEIGDVERVARETMREVREAVAAYRQPTLTGELDGARQLLEAAGIVCTIENSIRELPQTIDTVLAWTVREGVTNVIRHSRARHCTIQISSFGRSVRAEVTNDGYQGSALEKAAIKTGSGLAGLTERVTACGGHVEAGPAVVGGNQGFRLTVEIPYQSEVVMAGEAKQ
ncbi:MAG: histidine kinase [Chloroflexi bacterium]|nr:histidine kinase [Chloroflexota bacterium]MCI0577780.1 histidine kinase [Chloroflexota bacterium]MCI0643414.1 histidine kinase [Chloroflexota bacterium]MCI0731040.1 histidine kinase [Chloroflexota bacterium]